MIQGRKTLLSSVQFRAETVLDETTLRLIRETGDGFVLNSQYWTAVHTFAALVKTQEAFYQRSADV